MNLIITMSNGETIPFKSRYETLTKAYMEVLAQRFLEIGSTLYVTTSIVKIEKAV